MIEDKLLADQPIKKRLIKQPETVRQQAERKSAEEPKTRRLNKARTGAGRSLKRAASFGAKEYYLPLPDNRFGRFLNKRRHVIPSYFRNAWAELRNVEWPSRRETWRLTMAVFGFAIIFGVAITIVDYGLDKLFKNLLLK